MYADYQGSILKKLEKEKSAGILSLRLSQPTPAKLKEECIEVCMVRFDGIDENILSAFFGKQPDRPAYIKAIKRCETSKFKPMLNFINRRTVNPDTRIVELLAWLIDFEPRPWDMNKKYESDSEELIIRKGGQQKGEDDKASAETKVEAHKPGIDKKRLQTATNPNLSAQLNSSFKPDTKKINNKRVLLVVALCLLLVSSFYFFSKRENTGNKQDKEQACMYWSFDHYEPVSCNKKMGDIMVIALDTVKQKYFKKIMKEDTITYNSIGKLWYIKINNKLEYYTARGKHPLNPTLILKPITAHIIDTWVSRDSLNK